MVEPPPRCRFAPSPTGYLHVGSAQSALFNWLFARSRGGEFLLRIEDTDAERNRPELTANIVDMLEWLGLDWDGDALHQSDRLADHRAAADRLVDTGHAYWCDCAPAEVAQRNRGSGGAYDGFCRDRGLAGGAGLALRFRSPDDGVTAWDDVIRGKVSFENANLEDFVLLRSNGLPTFLLANVTDDVAMGITHVIRGEDHVNGTPKYLLVRAALGLALTPTFAHLPLLVNEQRKKLSKRRDDVSVADYKAAGYLPEAMRNYLALLGWGPPDEVEVRPIEEIVALFQLSDVNPAPAFFDRRKLDHVNAEWARRLDVGEFVARAAPFLPAGERPMAALRSMAPMVQERVKTLADVDGLISFLYLDEVVIDEAAWAKAARDPGAGAVLDATVERFVVVDWEADSIEEAVSAVAVALGLVGDDGRPQLRKVQAPIRVAVTGRAVGPPLWQSLAVLGRERTLERLRSGRARLP